MDEGERTPEETERYFIHTMREEAKLENGFALGDNGSLETVLICPSCGFSNILDTRDDAIFFLEFDRKCIGCDAEQGRV